MAEFTPIQVTVDKDKLAAEVTEAMEGALYDFAVRLEGVAFNISAKFSREHNDFIENVKRTAVAEALRKAGEDADGAL